MTTTLDRDASIETVRRLFLAQTGLKAVQILPEMAGPDEFLRIVVGRDAPLYRVALDRINRELPVEDPFHGALTLDVRQRTEPLKSLEVQLLRSLITRSLRITTGNLIDKPAIQFAPFRGDEQRRAAETANHAIVGRRGVGKSSLILQACETVMNRKHIPVWVDIEPYRGRSDEAVSMEILAEVLKEALDFVKDGCMSVAVDGLASAHAEILTLLGKCNGAQGGQTQRVVPRVRARLRDFTRSSRTSVFLFLDDAHLLAPTIQPLVFGLIHSVLKGIGWWLKISGVKSLLRLYDASTRTGLQPPNDVQLIALDLTLEDPAAARDHLEAVLNGFLEPCGFRKRSDLVQKRAIDRLVWCSAGVPRDFLWLLDRSIAFAVQHGRRKVGVEEVNLAVGEFGQNKLNELDQDTTQEGSSLKAALDRLRARVLEECRSNSFLVRQQEGHEGYRLLQKLVDLRLVHLVRPGITPGKAGERYVAYLLDYSFYTGVRRRHRLSELKITADKRPDYDTLRRLPKVDLDTLCGQA